MLGVFDCCQQAAGMSFLPEFLLCCPMSLLRSYKAVFLLCSDSVDLYGTSAGVVLPLTAPESQTFGRARLCLLYTSPSPRDRG
eukprot:6476368-Amphidinium_carterae.2